MNIEDYHKLNNKNLNIDEKIDIILKADEVDTYLLTVIQRFKEKIDFEKYYLSYSGGKDSHLLYWIIKELLEDNKITIVGINTFLEHPEIRERLYKYSDVILYPLLKPNEIKEKYGIPCFSKQQDEYIERYQKGCRTNSLMQRVNGFSFIGENGKLYKSAFKLNNKARDLLLNNKLHKISPKCCLFMKKKPAHLYEKESGKKPILGIRSNESIIRKSKYQTCLNKNGKFTPLWDLTDDMENKIYKKFNIEIPEIYNYIFRTGCMGCPYGYHKGDTIKELNLINENQRKYIIEYFKESYKILGILGTDDKEGD